MGWRCNSVVEPLPSLCRPWAQSSARRKSFSRFARMCALQMASFTMPGRALVTWLLLWKYFLPKEGVTLLTTTTGCRLGEGPVFSLPGACRDLDWGENCLYLLEVALASHVTVWIVRSFLCYSWWRIITGTIPLAYFSLMHPGGRLFLNAPLLFEWIPLFGRPRFIDPAFCKPDSQDQRSKSTLCHEEIFRFFFFCLLCLPCGRYDS